jgi:hypothetical protein
MQDAFNLAWKLALAARGRASPTLLDSYGPERLPIAQSLVGRTDMAMTGIEGATSLHNPISVGMRNTLMSFVSKLSIVQDTATRTLSMLEQNYRNSPLSAQDRPGLLAGGGLSDWTTFGDGPAPGDRAPDAPVLSEEGTPSTLHRLFRSPAFQLLLFAEPGKGGSSNLADISQRVRERLGNEVLVHRVVADPGAGARGTPGPDAGILADPEGALHKRFGARAECLYLLRPDGYVAYRSNPADGDKLLAYLDRVFAPSLT